MPTKKIKKRKAKKRRIERKIILGYTYPYNHVDKDEDFRW